MGIGSTHLHDTGLLVKGKVCHIDGARALIDGRRHPQDFSVRIDEHVRFVSHFVISVSTAEMDRDYKSERIPRGEWKVEEEGTSSSLLVKEHDIRLPHLVGG